MKRFCLFLIATGAVLWELCDTALLLEHPIFFTILFALALSLSLSALLYTSDVQYRVERLEKRVQALEEQIHISETSRDSGDKEKNP